MWLDKLAFFGKHEMMTHNTLSGRWVGADARMDIANGRCADNLDLLHWSAATQHHG
jgi:hypothetical protein